MDEITIGRVPLFIKKCKVSNFKRLRCIKEGFISFLGFKARIKGITRIIVLRKSIIGRN